MAELYVDSVHAVIVVLANSSTSSWVDYWYHYKVLTSEMYRKLVQESQCSLKFNFCFPIQYILATRKIKHARISFSVILFGEDDFLQRKRNRQTELISIFPLHFSLDIFRSCSTFYIN